MQTFLDILDSAKARTGSDRKTAHALGITQGSASDWRRGIAHPTDEQAMKLAELVELDAAYVLAVVRASRAKSEAARETWTRIARAFASVLVVVGAAGGSVTPSPAQAGPIGHNVNSEYTLRDSRRRRKAGQGAPGSPLARAALAALGLSGPDQRAA